MKARYGDRIHFRVIGDGSYLNEALGIQGKPWGARTEVASLSDMDIMPLPLDLQTVGVARYRAIYQKSGG